MVDVKIPSRQLMNDQSPDYLTHQQDDENVKLSYMNKGKERNSSYDADSSRRNDDKKESRYGILYNLQRLDPDQKIATEEFENYLRTSIREVKNSAHDMGRDRREREQKHRQWFNMSYGPKKATTTISGGGDKLGSVELSDEKLEKAQRNNYSRQESVLKIREQLLNGVS